MATPKLTLAVAQADKEYLEGLSESLLGSRNISLLLRNIALGNLQVVPSRVTHVEDIRALERTLETILNQVRSQLP